MLAKMIFPGQASQFIGMGRDYYDEFPLVRELYKEANNKLGFDITGLSFAGDIEELTQTKNAQPAILLHSIAVLSVLQGRGIYPSIAAGHSLGEFSALVAAGFFKAMDALMIVRRRGELMFDAGLKRPGAMAAIIGLEQSAVEQCVSEASGEGIVVIANYNTDKQLAVSGEVQAVDKVVELALDAGARRALRLQVSGAFHSPLMQEAAGELMDYISGFNQGRLRLPWVSNVSGAAVEDKELVLPLLEKQLTSPVKWIDCMNTLIALKSGHLLEVGPGRVLAGLVKRIAGDVSVTSLSTTEGLEQTVSLE